MKKFICTRSTLEVEEKIWRGNIQPTDEKSFEFKYNDPTKYIRIEALSNYPDQKLDALLKEFPEYIDGWETIITNTGLTCFYTNSQEKNNFVIYDIFDNDKIELSNIKPDVSMLLKYNMFNQPLNVRKINFKDNKFIPDKYYKKDGHTYIFINCDKIEGYSLDANLYFRGENSIEKIKYNYKSLFIFKIYNSNGQLKDGTIKINESLIAEKYSNGIYFIDLSSIDPIDNNGFVSISLENCGNGYLEVI